MALASRLGVEPHDDNGKVETALSFLEEATGVASTAVSESSADASRLRQSMDSLPSAWSSVTRVVASSFAIRRPKH